MERIKTDIRLQGVLCGLIGVVAVLSLFCTELLQGGENLDPVLVWKLGLLGTMYGFILTYLAYVIGKKLGQKQELDIGCVMSRESLLKAVKWGFILSLVYICVELIFTRTIPMYEIAGAKGVALVYLVLYTGVLEEIWMRLGLLTVLTYALDYARIKWVKRELPEGIAIKTAIVLMAVLYMGVNLLKVQQVYTFTVFLTLKVLLTYFILPIVWGLLYYKRGIMYVIVVHSTMLLSIYAILVPIYSVLVK